MGKYRQELERLNQLKLSNRDILNSYSSLMDDYGKSYHTSQVDYFDDEITRILPLVLDELVEEAVKRIDIKVKNEATPALQDLKRELQSLGK